jgi:hypothetical protein
MGAAAGASGLSIAGLGLTAYGDVMKGEGTKAADEMQADRAERAAQFGRLQAGLTDTVMREQLNTHLSNIDTIRAAAKVDPTSPTTAAVEDFETMKADRARTAALVSINAQVSEDEASAAYLRQAGSYALTQGYVSAGADILKGLSPLLAGLGGSPINSASVGDPTRLGSLY